MDIENKLIFTKGDGGERGLHTENGREDMYSSHGATRDMVASRPPILVAQFGLVLLTAIREFFFHGRIPGGHVERSPRNRKEERTQWLAGVMRRSLLPVLGTESSFPFPFKCQPLTSACDHSLPIIISCRNLFH